MVCPNILVFGHKELSFSKQSSGSLSLSLASRSKVALRSPSE